MNDERKESCEWSQANGWEGDTWEGSCGAVWSFIVGGPAENDMRYCPKCGGKVQIDAAHPEEVEE